MLVLDRKVTLGNLIEIAVLIISFVVFSIRTSDRITYIERQTASQLDDNRVITAELGQLQQITSSQTQEMKDFRSELEIFEHVLLKLNDPPEPKRRPERPKP